MYFINEKGEEYRPVWLKRLVTGWFCSFIPLLIITWICVAMNISIHISFYVFSWLIWIVGANIFCGSCGDPTD